MHFVGLSVAKLVIDNAGNEQYKVLQCFLSKEPERDLKSHHVTFRFAF
jgi:hypothetical protein